MLHHLQLYVYVNRGTDMKMNIDIDLYRYLQKDQVSGSEIRLYFHSAITVSRVTLQMDYSVYSTLLRSDERHMNTPTVATRLFCRRGIQKYKFLCVQRRTAASITLLRKRNNLDLLHRNKFLLKRGVRFWVFTF